MVNFLKRLFQSDLPCQKFDQYERNAAQASADDDRRKRDEEMKLERLKWELKNELAKKRDAAYLHMKKTAFDSYEQYLDIQQYPFHQLTNYANAQAQMNSFYGGQAGLRGISGIFG